MSETFRVQESRAGALDKMRSKIPYVNFDLKGGGALGSGYSAIMEIQMTKFQSDTAGWSEHRHRIKFIHYVLEQFPEMDDVDGEILADCLASLTQGHDLSSEQENACRWWDAWLKAIHQGCFAIIVGFSLARRDTPTAAIHDELLEARQRLRQGEDMTPRQAAYWGHHVVKLWDARSRRVLKEWNCHRLSFR